MEKVSKTVATSGSPCPQKGAGTVNWAKQSLKRSSFGRKGGTEQGDVALRIFCREFGRPGNGANKKKKKENGRRGRGGKVGETRRGEGGSALIGTGRRFEWEKVAGKKKIKKKKILAVGSAHPKSGGDGRAGGADNGNQSRGKSPDQAQRLFCMGQERRSKETRCTQGMGRKWLASIARKMGRVFRGRRESLAAWVIPGKRSIESNGRGSRHRKHCDNQGAGGEREI